jgi:FtsZ-binding cell division protein ZapB
MEIIKTYTCPCSPGKFFSSSSGLSQHKRTKKHLAYEEKSKQQKISETKRDNEIFTLNLRIKDRDEQIEKLIMEKHELQEKNKKLLEYENDICLKLEQLQTNNKRLKNENVRIRTLLETIKKDV